MQLTIKLSKMISCIYDVFYVYFYAKMKLDFIKSHEKVGDCKGKGIE